ncbi:alpha/beta hydrolase [Streptomyces sp. NPDC050997]|uniref:alpha/beta hydrolase n=1 Tax=Streptomyces sp. NPDC050997 TaxID=3155519 RepID=UPI00344ADD75
MEEWGPLVAAVAGIWPKVTDQLSDPELGEFEGQLLAPLRVFDEARESVVRDASTDAEPPSGTVDSTDPSEAVDSAARAVAAVFRARPPLGEWLTEEFDRLSGELERFGPADPPPFWPVQLRSLQIPVMYATDRAGRTSKTAPLTYGSERGRLSYGQATVSVPDEHRVGAVDKPRWWRLRFRPDPVRDVLLASTAAMTADDFADGVRRQLDQCAARHALVFVHGFNVSFADAAVHAAQLAYDLNFTGPVLLYSWPSKGSVLDYPADGDAARRSVPYFQEFLRRLLTGTGVDEVHVIAHSMGNRVLTDGLAGLDTRALPEGSGRLGHVVFAAPDVDGDVFRQLLPGILRQAGHSTLYVSARDRALAVSRNLADFPRAGQAGDSVIVVPGLDTVDVTELGTDLLGHSYVGNHRNVLADVYGLLHHGRTPSQRYGLTRVSHADGDYWSFQPQK